MTVPNGSDRAARRRTRINPLPSSLAGGGESIDRGADVIRRPSGEDLRRLTAADGSPGHENDSSRACAWRGVGSEALGGFLRLAAHARHLTNHAYGAEPADNPQSRVRR